MSHPLFYFEAVGEPGQYSCTRPSVNLTLTRHNESKQFRLLQQLFDALTALGSAYVVCHSTALQRLPFKSPRVRSRPSPRAYIPSLC